MAGRITQCLIAASKGESEAQEELFRLVEKQLMALARSRVRADGSYMELTPAELVNESYIRMFGQDDVPWKDRKHFFNAASTVMRHILIDEARRQSAEKRGGGKKPQSLDEQNVDMEDRKKGVQAERLLELHRALLEMQRVKPRAAEVLHLKYFGGQTGENIAKYLDISIASVGRNVKWANEWLRGKLGDDSDDVFGALG